MTLTKHIPCIFSLSYLGCYCKIIFHPHVDHFSILELFLYIIIIINTFSLSWFSDPLYSFSNFIISFNIIKIYKFLISVQKEKREYNNWYSSVFKCLPYLKNKTYRLISNLYFSTFRKITFFFYLHLESKWFSDFSYSEQIIWLFCCPIKN